MLALGGCMQCAEEEKACNEDLKRNCIRRRDKDSFSYACVNWASQSESLPFCCCEHTADILWSNVWPPKATRELTSGCGALYPSHTTTTNRRLNAKPRMALLLYIIANRLTTFLMVSRSQCWFHSLYVGHNETWCMIGRNWCLCRKVYGKRN